MSLPNIEQLSLETKADQGTAATKDGKMSGDNAFKDDDEDDPVVSRAIATVEEYLKANAPTFRELKQLREKGWQSSDGDRFFAEQRRTAAESSGGTVRRLNKVMGNIAREMQSVTKAFTIKSQIETKRVLDLCMAPGTYLNTALQRNPTTHALAFTLPPERGGLIPIVNESDKVKIHFLDITMLAADMGLAPEEIDPSHPDAASFIHERFLDDGRNFDLAICDGAISRRPPERATDKMNGEARRLLLTQLALGLEHLRPGGTMIVLLHKVERLHTIRLLRDFKSFARVVLFKPKSGQAKRSSFYMVASNILSTDQEAEAAVQEWKREWKIATLGTDKEWRDYYIREAGFGELGAEGMLEDFGPTLVKLGQRVWKIQADALKAASFMKM